MCLGKKCSQVHTGERFKFRRGTYRTTVVALSRGKKTVPVETEQKRADDPDWVKNCDWCFNASPVELDSV